MNPFSNKNKISPIEFTEKYKDNPISFMQKDINTESSFAITKLTQGGKFLRGNLLFYSLNGVEVYTDPNNIIFVDTTNNTLFIKEYEKVINGLAPESPELKRYILLYVEIGYEEAEEGTPMRWESCQGRLNAYENIKVNSPVIDIDKSLVLVDNVSVKDSLTVREFVKYLQNSDIVTDDFNIDEFSSEYI